jgi:exodeoxyribonuclease VII small subunit
MAEPKFEKDLERLEKIVGELEEGELSLDDSLKRFEEGVKLSKRCEKALAEAEKKIEILTKNAEGEYEAEDFEEDSEVPAPKKKSKAKKKSAVNEDGDEVDEDGELLF